MSQSLRGTLVGSDHRARCVALAGALAEASFLEIELDGQFFTARHTDLPGVLSGAAPPMFLRSVGNTTISVLPDRIVWQTDREALHAALLRASR